ncbi:MAG: hypothetical protein N2442_13935 [Spirochaetes bacterium]|nr:hypothetical protein [Spirochaetota bacterium]
MNLKKLFLPSIVGLVLGTLSSCVDLETKIELNQDGSGKLELVYIVSSALVQLGSTTSPGVSLPLPIAEGDFRQTVSSIPGLSLQSYARKDEPDKSIIQALLTFSSLSDLNSLFGGKDPVISQSQEGSDRVVEVVISAGNPGGLDPKTKELVNAFFPTYSLKFHVILPGAVKRTSSNQSIVKGTSAQLSVPILKALEQETPIKWKIYW